MKALTARRSMAYFAALRPKTPQKNASFAEVLALLSKAHSRRVYWLGATRRHADDVPPQRLPRRGRL